MYGNNPVFLVSVLKGSAPFTVDLMKRLKMDVTLDFIAASSYGTGTDYSGHITVTKDMRSAVKGAAISFIILFIGVVCGL